MKEETGESGRCGKQGMTVSFPETCPPSTKDEHGRTDRTWTGQGTGGPTGYTGQTPERTEQNIQHYSKHRTGRD